MSLIKKTKIWSCLVYDKFNSFKQSYWYVFIAILSCHISYLGGATCSSDNKP